MTTTLHTDIRKNAEKILGFIDDPANRPGGQLVYRSMPRVKSQSFNGYPFIVMEDLTFNDTNETVNGFNTVYDIDLEFHVYGLEETEEDFKQVDSIADQLNFAVKGSDFIEVSTELGLANPSFIRQNRLTGINEKDQPITRYEVEIRGRLHLNMHRGVE